VISEEIVRGRFGSIVRFGVEVREGSWGSSLTSCLTAHFWWGEPRFRVVYFWSLYPTLPRFIRQATKARLYRQLKMIFATYLNFTFTFSAITGHLL
jgi:hypothetical protein